MDVDKKASGIVTGSEESSGDELHTMSFKWKYWQAGKTGIGLLAIELI